MADTTEFSTGLLNPERPVPALVKGQIERRYGVYRNNVTVGLIRALEANFPAVRKLLGDEYFAGFARDFAQKHPPQSPLMFTYGTEFPGALAQAVDLASYAYLGDVARLEILWRESYNAADATALSADTLAAIDPDVLFDCRFNFHPAARLLQSPFAILAIFLANRTETAEMGFNPTNPQSVLITRPQLEVLLHGITPAQFVFFSTLKNGAVLGTALERAAECDANFDLAGTLALLLQSGAFQSIHTGNETSSQ